MKEDINIFIHRRDFRLQDNMALNMLYSYYPNTPVMHVFIFNPVQIDPNKNSFFNNNCVLFMVQSLKKLRDELKGALNFFHGTDTNVLKSILATHRITAVAWNSDYTPFARNRDQYLLNWCEKVGIQTITCEDYSLFKMNSVLNKEKKFYLIFAPFYKRCLELSRNNIALCTTKKGPIYTKNIGMKNIDKYCENNLHLKVQGGRDHALEILEQIKKGTFKNYGNNKDFLYTENTTQLSAYIKFGCVSIREVFHCIRESCGLNHELLRQLLWREFYAHATWHFPHVLSGVPFQDTKMKWTWKKEWYEAIMNAKTGLPIIDAGVTELKTTGWINNRMRMIISSFICRHLGMDWKIFEKDLFGKYLVDYDPSSNCHSWQGMANVGIDSGPYWKLINPWYQMEKYDPEYKYIKKWLPILRDVDIKNWRSQIKSVKTYPPSMVNVTELAEQYLRKWS